jgi:hypothetical protein
MSSKRDRSSDDVDLHARVLKAQKKIDRDLTGDDIDPAYRAHLARYLNSRP